MSITVRFEFPLLAAGQAQKEVTHNQAVEAIDRMLHPSVKSRLLNAPPVTASLGDSWIVGDLPVGLWAGMSGSIAVFEGYGWSFVTPKSGMVTWIQDEFAMAVWHNGWSNGWPITRLIPLAISTVELPASGTTVDAEMRASFAVLVSNLQQLGLVA